MGLLSKWGGSPGAESVPCRWTCFGRARLPNGEGLLKGRKGGFGEKERGRWGERKEGKMRGEEKI